MDPIKNKPAQVRFRTSFEYILLACKGFCMGAADVVPGVSGGTMAFILGIYEELILSIRAVDLKSLKLLLAFKYREFLEHLPWKFLLTVALGIFTAIFTLARVLSWFLVNKPVLIWAFFFGLILASVGTVCRRIEAWPLPTWLCFLGGMTGTYFLVGLVPVSTPNDPWFLFLCGGVAICAMILPGISGAFILVLLGKYGYVLDAVNQRDMFVLFLIASGAFVGLVAFSRLLGLLLKKYHDPMVAFLAGLMIGSLSKVWPWKETWSPLTDAKDHVIPAVQSNVLPSQWTGEVLFAILLMVIGVCVVLLLDRFGTEGG